ncbi:MAG: hypothetical protein N2C14_27065 [Planctomycetales bacterium]
MSEYPHAIRLRGPWEYRVLERESEPASDSVDQGRMKAPCPWGKALGDGFRGTVRFQRNFFRPTNLDEDERVWLVLEGADAGADVSLNGQPLGRVEGYCRRAEFDVTSQLEPRNQITADVSLMEHEVNAPARFGRETLSGGLVGESRLEVRASSFLERLSVTMHADAAEITGAVGGEPPSENADLVLTVTGMNRELLFERVGFGQPFAFGFSSRDFPLWTLAPQVANALQPLEVALTMDGGDVWRTQLLVAKSSRPAYSFLASGELKSLVVEGTPVPFPVAEIEFSDEPASPDVFANTLAGRHAVIATRRILSEDHYLALDRLGVVVMQFVPSAGREILASLAHHACLVAWVHPHDEARTPSERASDHGRAWLNASELG